MKEIVLAVISVIISLVAVLLFVCLGWYIVWKLILCRFRFIKELVSGPSESPNVSDLKNGRRRVRRTRRD